MKTISLFLILLTSILIPDTSLASGKSKPFDPAFAADQRQITSRSIEFEGQQFHRIGEWLIAREEVETKSLEKEQAKDNLVRIQQLFKKGVASELQLKSAEYNFQKASSSLDIVLSEMNLHKAQGLKFKFLLMDEGNSSEDFRLQVAQAQKVARQETEKIFQSQLNRARSSVTYWTSQVERNRKLFEKRLIKRSQLEESELILKMSQDQLATIEHKITANQQALVGVEKIIRALNNG